MKNLRILFFLCAIFSCVKADWLIEATCDTSTNKTIGNALFIKNGDCSYVGMVPKTHAQQWSYITCDDTSGLYSEFVCYDAGCTNCQPLEDKKQFGGCTASNQDKGRGNNNYYMSKYFGAQKCGGESYFHEVTPGNQCLKEIVGYSKATCNSDGSFQYGTYEDASCSTPLTYYSGLSGECLTHETFEHIKPWFEEGCNLQL